MDREAKKLLFIEYTVKEQSLVAIRVRNAVNLIRGIVRKMNERNLFIETEDCISTVLRSVWEVLHFCMLAAQLESDPTNTELNKKVYQLKQIINIHKIMDDEAESLGMF